MKRTPVKIKSAARPQQTSRPGLPDTPRTDPGGGWVSFSYSHREITSAGGTTHVRSRDYRYENGRLESESFEGTLGPDAYVRAVEQAQKLVAAQTGAFLSLFSAFLPRPPKDR